MTTKSAAFVVGATGGLGRACALALAREWDAIALGYRSSSARADALAAQLPATCESLPVHCDLNDATSVNTAITTTKDRFGAIGTVVFASGVAIGQPFVSRITEEEWREVIEAEVIGLTRVVSTTLPVFREQGGGNQFASNHDIPRRPGRLCRALRASARKFPLRAMRTDTAMKHPRRPRRNLCRRAHEWRLNAQPCRHRRPYWIACSNSVTICANASPAGDIMRSGDQAMS